MTAAQFRHELKARLNRHATDVLLRILISADPLVELTGEDILRRSEQLASEVSTAAPGQVVLLLLPHSVELFLLHIGLILTGRVPAILAWHTSRVDPEKYQRNLLHQLCNLPATELITTPTLADSLRPGLPYPAIPCAVDGACRREEAFSIPLKLVKEDRVQPLATPLMDAAEALFLQFSGGTTGSQKAVVITAEILVRQLQRLQETLDFNSQDSVVSWLPLYHDMGLIGCLWLPLWHGTASVQLSASDWLLNPGLLFEFLDKCHGTFCWLPNFAFSYLSGLRKRMTKEYALGHVRGFVNCSEPIRLRSINAFVEAYADWGIRPEQMQASYAMAENVFAVTETQLDHPPVTFARTALLAGESSAPPSFGLSDEVYVSSGRAINGMQVRIVDAAGRECGEKTPGEIHLSTESLFSGYWGPSGYVTSSFTRDGWYATGDYGFLADGELYVIGRLKDIVIVGGQNIFPEDVEIVVNSLPGIYPGRAVAFGILNAHDTESLIVVAEMRGRYDREQAAFMEKEIAQLVLTSVGLAPGRVCVTPERWIVKSTAGKISRIETRARYLREQPLVFRNQVDCVETK